MNAKKALENAATEIAMLNTKVAQLESEKLIEEYERNMEKCMTLISGDLQKSVNEQVKETCSHLFCKEEKPILYQEDPDIYKVSLSTVSFEFSDLK